MATLMEFRRVLFRSRTSSRRRPAHDHAAPWTPQRLVSRRRDEVRDADRRWVRSEERRVGKEWRARGARMKKRKKVMIKHMQFMRYILYDVEELMLL